MTVEKLINIVRLGRQLAPAQSRAVITQLERIPAMERTLASKDRDFTRLSIAYSAAVDAGKASGVQFTADECGYVNDALAECERLKEAVRWERECDELITWLVKTGRYPEEPSARIELLDEHECARKAVEELL